jgi:hypothetical protein
MADCNFKLPFTESPTVVISRAKAAIQNHNGVFNGDEKSGDFDITVFGNTIKGIYSVNEQILNLTITHKPFFVPCSTIENLLLKEIS